MQLASSPDLFWLAWWRLSRNSVYFDNTIGRNATVTVSVGEEVTMVSSWSNTIALYQVAYDTASRAYNKAVRDRNYFQQYGTAPGASWTQTSSDSDEADLTTTVSPQQRHKTEASNYQTCAL